MPLHQRYRESRIFYTNKRIGLGYKNKTTFVNKHLKLKFIMIFIFNFRVLLKKKKTLQICINIR